MSYVQLYSPVDLISLPTYDVEEIDYQRGATILDADNDYYLAYYLAPWNKITEMGVYQDDSWKMIITGMALNPTDDFIQDANNGRMLKYIPQALKDDDTIIGSKGNDSIGGYGGNDFIESAGGHDLVEAGSGDDLVLGGPGNDTVWGQDGDDVMVVGKGADLVNGGNGSDIVIAYGLPAVKLDLNLSGYQRLSDSASVRLTRVEGLGGGNGDDTLLGSDAANVLGGGDGNDLVNGKGGNDRILGGRGNDKLVGGDGSDVFVYFNSDSGSDVIRDFRNGVDLIEINTLYYNPDDARIIQDGADTVIRYGDDSIRLLGVRASVIDENDFIFV